MGKKNVALSIYLSCRENRPKQNSVPNRFWLSQHLPFTFQIKLMETQSRDSLKFLVSRQFKIKSGF